MAELTPTLVKSQDSSAGNVKTKIFTVVPQADGDTVPLATWFGTLYGAICYLTAGLDANLTHLIPSFSGTTVTIAQKKADGATAADNWTSASITMHVTGLDVGL